jgi:hypothetical protein
LGGVKWGLRQLNMLFSQSFQWLAVKVRFYLDILLEKWKMENVKAIKKEAGQRYEKHVRISAATHRLLRFASIRKNRTLESLADEIIALALKRERAA